MKKRKWTFWSFETNEMGALSMYLEQMAEKGWFPDKIEEWGIVFYEGEPEQRRYAAAFVPGGSFITGPDSYEARKMREQCGKAGWKFQCGGPGIQIFYARSWELPLAEPLKENIQFSIQKKRLMTSWFTVALLLVFFVWAMRDVLENPGKSLADPESLADGLLLVILSVFFGGRILECIFWFVRGSRQMKDTGILLQHSLGYVKAKTLATAFLGGFLLAGYLGISGLSSRNSVIFFAIMALFFILLGMQSWIRLHGSGDTRVKKGKYAVCSAAVSVIFLGTAVFLMEKNIPENRALQEDTWEWMYPLEKIAPEYDTVENYLLENLKSPAAVYQSQIGRSSETGARMMIEYFESPIPAALRFSRSVYPKDRGDKWRITRTELSAEAPSMTVVRFHYSLEIPGVSVREDSGDAFDTYVITDESRLLVLNFSEAMEPEAIKAAEEAFQSQKEAAESEMKKR